MTQMNALRQREEKGYPVLIIPGYGAPAFQSEIVGRYIRSSGLDVVKVKLPWMAMGDMTRSAKLVAEQVDRLRDTYGFDKVNFFGYSLGGIITRYYLQELEGHSALNRGAFVSSPYSGTYIGYLGFFSAAGRQVRPNSTFMKRLDDSPLRELIESNCLSIYVRWDGVIVPSTSSYLSCGYNISLSRPVSHWMAVTNRRIALYASEFLLGGIPEGAVPGHELALPEARDMLAVPAAAPIKKQPRVWQVLWKPVRSLAARIAALFRRGN